MNKLLLTGTVFKKFENDYNTQLTIKSQRDWKGKEDKYYPSDFIKVTAKFKNKENIDKLISEGDYVEIEATIENNNYEKDGKKVYKDDNVVTKFKKIYMNNESKKEDSEDYDF